MWSARTCATERRHWLGIVAVLAIVIAGSLAACGGSSAVHRRGSSAVAKTTATPFPKGWSVDSSLGVGQEGSLVAVTALSAINAWAVGQYEGLDSLKRTLIEHWDGSRWTVQQSPSSGQKYNLLHGVSASSQNDAWAVGYDISTDSIDQPLIEHWDGASWTVSASPAVGAAGGELDGVASVSPTDAWAVGFVSIPSSANTPPGNHPLVEHWDGHAWSIVQSAALPDPQDRYNSVPYNELHAITALSANDIWAAGGGNAGASAPGMQALLEHWDGHAWSIVPSANPDPNGNALTGLAAVSPHDIWAVGGNLSYNSQESAVVEPIIEHWDGSHWAIAAGPVNATAQGLIGIAAAPGSAVWAVGQVAAPNGPAGTLVEQESAGQWSVVASPSPGTLRNALNSVAAISTKDVWAVGESAAGTLAEHWNGDNWNVVSTPNSTSFYNVLNGVSAVTSNDVWAVGSATVPGSGGQALIEHWNGEKWSAASGASASGATLYGVAALSASNVWAVGSSPGTGPLVEHWDGTRWSVVPTPTSVSGMFMSDYALYSIAAAAPDDIWTAGGMPVANCSSVAPALIEHWDGKQWAVVTGLPQGVLHSLAFAGANDAWAVGQLGNDASMLHWDGKQWAAVQGAPLPAHAYPTFQAVAAHAAGDVWTVGYAYDSQGKVLPQAQHWDGHSWTAAQLNAPGVADNRLNGITAVSTGEFWAVGSYDDWNGWDARQALIEHFQP